MYILFIIGAVFIFLGVGIKYFKWHFLISGYNTMSKNQKKNVDIEGLASIMGNYMFIIGTLMLITGIFTLLGYKSMSTYLYFVIIPVTIILIIKAQKYDHNGDSKKGKKGGTTAIIGIILVTLLLVSGLLLVGVIESKIVVNPEEIIISGMYKRIIDRDDITVITLQDNIPKVLQKVNGFDFGYTLKGNFELEGIGRGNLYIQENISPYIVIKTEDRFYIINFKDPQKTKILFEELIK